MDMDSNDLKNKEEMEYELVSTRYKKKNFIVCKVFS